MSSGYVPPLCTVVTGDSVISAMSYFTLGSKLPRYDRLALPGGPACLATSFPVYHAEQAVIEQLRFLVQVHLLERVILIAHQDCAFYTERLHISPGSSKHNSARTSCKPGNGSRRSSTACSSVRILPGNLRTAWSSLRMCNDVTRLRTRTRTFDRGSV